MRKSELSEKMIATDLTIGHTQEQVREFVEKAVHYGLYGVCVFQNMVKTAVDTAQGRLKVCTVTGYPSGIDVPATKIADAFFPPKAAPMKLILGSICRLLNQTTKRR